MVLLESKMRHSSRSWPRYLTMKAFIGVDMALDEVPSIDDICGDVIFIVYGWCVVKVATPNS